MGCKINKGLNKADCQFLIGGVKNIYLANFEDITSFTDNNSDNILDTVTMSTSGLVFYKFETAKNTSSYTTVLQVNGGVKNVLHTVDLFVPNNSQESRDLLELLSLGTFVAIVEDRMGKKIVLGKLNGLEATVGDFNSGVAETDQSSLHVTLAGTEMDYGVEFDGVIPV